MIDRPERVVAPLVRGFASENGVGPVVRRSNLKSSEAAAAEPLELPAPRPEQDSSAYAETVAEALAAAGRASLPRAVTAGGEALLLLGESVGAVAELEQLLRAGKKPPQGPPSSGAGAPQGAAVHASRAAVMAGRICVVTGAAQGFGENMAREFVRAGAYVVLGDINESGAARVSDELNEEANAGVSMAKKVDVSNEDSVRALIASVVDAVGGIDLFVSNAGVLRAKPVRELDVESFEFVTNVNYKGFFLCTKHAAGPMALQNRGRQAAAPGREAGYFSDIIQINSKSGLEGSNRNAAYAGSKFGGIGLVQSFAKELVEQCIKVNAVCPGNFFDGPLWSDPETGLFVQYLNAGKIEGAKTVEDVKRAYEAKVPFGRGCRAEDVVRAIYYIVEQQYETGQAVPVTGGQVMMR